MTTDHDANWQALQSAGNVPPASPEVLARARRRLPRTRTSQHGRRLVPVLAAAVAVLAAAAVIQQNGDNRTPPTAAPPATPSLTAQTPPTSPTQVPTPPPGPPQSNGQCVAAPTPAELAKVGAALDGTVLNYLVLQSNPPQYLLTVRVHQWFRSGSGGHRQIAVRTWAPPGGGHLGEAGPEWRIGSRLLIAGAPRTSGGRLYEIQLRGCGFSRPYTAADAATWRKLFKK